MNYRTKSAWLGLPLVHVSTGEIVEGRYRRGVAQGWIAIGDISFGVLLSVGGVALGGIALGGLALGGLAFAGMAVGAVAFGGSATGVVALGGAAIAWHGALGGLAIAREYALGGVAIARHANDAAAREFFESGLAAQAKAVMDHADWLWLLFLIVPAIIVWNTRRRRAEQAGPGRRES
jgi:hypothetical protein